MRIAFVVSTQPTQFAAASFAPDFEGNVARLAALGYQGIELAVRDPSRLDAESVRRSLDAHHLAVPAIATGQAYVEEHLSFTDPDPDVRQRMKDRIQSHIRLAHEFDALLILGLVRGKQQPGVTLDQTHAWLLEAMQEVAQKAREQKVRLVIEPINRYETNLLNTVDETRALIGEIGADNVGILFDTFHANIEEAQIQASLRACGPLLFHVHVADSNRWAPGAGHIDFRTVIATLQDMNYTGWISGEMLAKPSLLGAAEQTIAAIGPLLKQ
jgi:sugar phosphate isomerase/epimerase